MKTEILRLLSESSEAVSGQKICDRLQVSRTAVWKAVKQLREEGYQIDAVSNKGYTLKSSPDVITEEAIASRINTDTIGRHVCCLSETPSTNSTARQLADQGAVHGTLVAADIQSAGKGRRGRGWESPAGTGIFMSLILKPDIQPDKASMMTLVMALAVKQGIRQVTGIDCAIKWPNDIIINGKKVCGILTELSAEVDYVQHVVIGAGINVNTQEFPAALSDKATSLAIESGQRFNRSELIARIMECFEEYYLTYISTQDLSRLREQYNQAMLNLGGEVTVLTPGSECRGTALGINDQGELLLQLPDGQVERIYAGEVSVRGVYGYV